MGTPAPSPVVLVIGPSAASDLRAWLGAGGWDTVERTPDNVPDGLAGFSAAVLDGRADGTAAAAVCRRLALRPAENRCPVVVLSAADDLASRLAAFDTGADAVLPRSVAAAELLAQLRALDRWQRVRAGLAARAAEAQLFNQRLQQAYRQIDMDLALARRLQASFLPQSLPAVGPMRFAVSYRPCGQVGGDFYDVFRLDEQHVGFYVADAMGHGVPASLLTIFLKKVVHPKEIRGGSYRLVPPEEVLARINRELIGQGLADLPFITMVYGLLNCRDGALRFARAAHPHPVYVPQAGTPEQWETEGTLLGIFEAEFPPQQRHLRPGDKLLLFTDGASSGAGPGGLPDPMLSAAEEHRELPIDALVERLSDDLVTVGPHADDFTMLGIEFAAA